MDDIQLTQLFIDYAKLRDQLELTKDMIVREILERGESAKIAGVTASYYKPSFGTPDYEGAVKSYLEVYPHMSNDLAKFQTTVVTTKWKEACDYYLIEAPQGEEKPARVVIK